MYYNVYKSGVVLRGHVNVFAGCILGFDQRKDPKSVQISHSGPSNLRKAAFYFSFLLSPFLSPSLQLFPSGVMQIAGPSKLWAWEPCRWQNVLISGVRRDYLPESLFKIPQWGLNPRQPEMKACSGGVWERRHCDDLTIYGRGANQTASRFRQSGPDGPRASLKHSG